MGTSSSRHGHHDSFMKRALHSLFGMCRNIAHDVHKNTRSINEIRGHLGLPLTEHHDLPEFDNPFAEWDAADEAAIAAAHDLLPCARRQTRSTCRRAATSFSRALLVAKRFLMRTRRLKKKSPRATTSIATLMRMRTLPRTPPKMMMSKRSLCCFSFPFWHLMTKGE